MRHRKRGRKLGRSSSHREALRRNLAAALLRHERVVTTLMRAKEIRPFVEKLITMGRRALEFKNSSDPKQQARYLHYYRLVLSRLQDKEMAQKIFGEGEWREGTECLAARYADRPGGYTRIIRIGGSRLGLPVGTTVSGIPSLTYELAGRERSVKLVGRRLGDGGVRVLFDLMEKGAGGAGEQEVAPTVAVTEASESEEKGGASA